jgi:hypothetical protein
MGGRSNENDAAKRGAKSLSLMEEFVFSMGQRSNDAALKDAQNKLKMEECALSTGQRGQESDAAKEDAQIKFKKVECASSMEHTNARLPTRKSKRLSKHRRT